MGELVNIDIFTWQELAFIFLVIRFQIDVSDVVVLTVKIWLIKISATQSSISIGFIITLLRFFLRNEPNNFISDIWHLNKRTMHRATYTTL